MNEKEIKKYKLTLGYSENYDDELPTIYDIKDRFTHTYILGKSEMGKSALMERMAKYDIDWGASVIYIDPKGDSVKKLYHLCDQSKLRYVSADHPIVINPLEKEGYLIDNIIAEFVQVLDTLITLTSINPESSVRMKELLDYAVKSFTPEQMNLNYLKDFLSYENVRRKHKYPSLEYETYWKAFDKKQGQYYEKRFYHDTADSISSRLAQFINHAVMRKFVTGKNELDISELVRTGRSLLVDTSQLRPDQRIFVSNLIIYAVATYCQYHSVKKPLLVYVDEAQTVASHLFCDVLEFGRSAKVGFTIAHHNFTQIKREIINSIFGIVSTFIVFRCGDDEGKRMAEIYGLKPTQFYNLQKHQAWVRLSTDNILIETFKPFLKEAPDVDIPVRETAKPINYWRDEWIVV